MPYHRPLEDYFGVRKGLSDYVRELADVRSFPTHRSDGVGETVLGLVQRYALRWMDIEADSIPEARRLIQSDGNLDPYGMLARACVNDIPATASLVQELAFTPVPLNEDRTVHFADLGTGSGVLALATAIGAMRSGAKKIVGHCIDSVPQMLDRTRGLLETAAPKAHFSVREGDITDSTLYQSLPVAHIRSWVSETINGHIIRMDVTPEGVTFTGVMGEVYPVVLDRLLRNVPNFHADVSTGKTLLFPDPINDQYRPHSPDETMRLKTSKSHAAHAPLGKVGTDFIGYEPIVHGFRWGMV